MRTLFTQPKNVLIPVSILVSGRVIKARAVVLYSSGMEGGAFRIGQLTALEQQKILLAAALLRGYLLVAAFVVIGLSACGGGGSASSTGSVSVGW